MFKRLVVENYAILIFALSPIKDCWEQIDVMPVILQVLFTTLSFFVFRTTRPLGLRAGVWAVPKVNFRHLGKSPLISANCVNLALFKTRKAPLPVRHAKWAPFSPSVVVISALRVRKEVIAIMLKNVMEAFSLVRPGPLAMK